MTESQLKPMHLLLACTFVWSAGYATAHAALPSFAQVQAAHLPSEAWLVDRNGAPLDTLRLDPSVRRLPWVPLQALSPAMRHALIESEDKRFYQHGGVDWRAFVSAAWENLVHDTHRGASTLTMQLAGLLDPTLYRAPGGRTYTQKLDQIKAARELERTWSKQQILEAYLNRVNFRGELAGINAAAQGLFGKSPSSLGNAEASILAALLRGPNAKPSVVAKRACGVTKNLAQPRPTCAAITLLADTALAAKAPIDFGEQLAPQLAQRFLRIPGDRVQVSLDAGLQRFALQMLQARIAALKNYHVEDGAVVVIDNKTGEILAYVGSPVSASSMPVTDSASASHPAGAMLHPFLYGLAIEKRLLTAASLLENSPRIVEPANAWTLPQNDPDFLDDWVTLRAALGSSMQVPAHSTLTLVTPETFSTRLQDIGLSRYYPSAAWSPDAPGNARVNLLALTNAYRVLANGGVHKPASFRAGSSAVGWRVMPAPAAAIITDILADRQARYFSWRLRNALITRGFAAVIASSKDNRNHWCVGFSGHYTVGVWLGNAAGKPSRSLAESAGAAPVWQALINRLNAARRSRPPRLPSGVVMQTVQFEPALAPERRELFLPGTEQSVVALAETDENAPRILGPANGAILTLDPVIPETWQKVRFYAHQMRPQWNWRVDGAPAPIEMLQNDGSLSYTPQPGDHRISLTNEQDEVLDRLYFTVDYPIQISP